MTNSDIHRIARTPEPARRSPCAACGILGSHTVAYADLPPSPWCGHGDCLRAIRVKLQPPTPAAGNLLLADNQEFQEQLLAALSDYLTRWRAEQRRAYRRLIWGMVAGVVLWGLILFSLSRLL